MSQIYVPGSGPGIYTQKAHALNTILSQSQIYSMLPKLNSSLPLRITEHEKYAVLLDHPSRYSHEHSE